MAQWNKDAQQYRAQTTTNFEVVNIATKNGTQVSSTNPLPVTLGSENITITGDVNIGTTVTVDSTPEDPVHVHVTEIVEAEIKNDTGNPIPVIFSEQTGNLFSFNNHAINVHRGWTMDDVMRPVVSIRVNSAGTSVTDLIEIVEYEIGNNNANQSTIIYEWYEGNLTLSGAAIPSWTSFGTKGQYRIYQDVYGSNTGNTFTQNSSVMRHSGIIIGKNTSNDEGPATMNGGASPNMLTLCMKRVDNGTELDVWFAFTCKELA
jgi:phage protein U